jgi:hypothetical protein
VLESRRDAACDELREARNERYRQLLDGQRDMRAQMHQRQELGLDNALFLQEPRNRNAGSDVQAGFREAADEAAMPHSGSEREAHRITSSGGSGHEAGRHSGAALEAEIGPGLGLRLVSLFDILVFDVLEPKTPAPPRQPEPPGRLNPFEASAVEAQKQQQQQKLEEVDAERSRNERWRYGD